MYLGIPRGLARATEGLFEGNAGTISIDELHLEGFEIS